MDSARGGHTVPVAVSSEKKSREDELASSERIAGVPVQVCLRGVGPGGSEPVAGSEVERLGGGV